MFPKKEMHVEIVFKVGPFNSKKLQPRETFDILEHRLEPAMSFFSII